MNKTFIKVIVVMLLAVLCGGVSEVNCNDKNYDLLLETENDPEFINVL